MYDFYIFCFCSDEGCEAVHASVFVKHIFSNEIKTEIVLCRVSSRASFKTMLLTKPDFLKSEIQQWIQKGARIDLDAIWGQLRSEAFDAKRKPIELSAPKSKVVKLL